MYFTYTDLKVILSLVRDTGKYIPHLFYKGLWDLIYASNNKRMCFHNLNPHKSSAISVLLHGFYSADGPQKYVHYNLKLNSKFYVIFKDIL